MTIMSHCPGVPPLLAPEPNIREWRRHARPFYAHVVVLAACIGIDEAPASFFVAAVRAMQQDEDEEIVVLASSTGSAAVRALRSLPLARVRVVPYNAGQNATLDRSAHFALIAADHVVVEHPSFGVGRAEHRERMGAPYHAQWIWCGASMGGAVCNDPTLRDNHSHMVVQVRLRQQQEDEQARRGSSSFEVRSTLTAPRWVPFPEHLLASSPALPSSALPNGMWSRRDVCIGYDEPRSPPYAIDPGQSGGGRSQSGGGRSQSGGGGAASFADRRAVLLQAAARDGSAQRPLLLWPLRWPRHYTDGSALPFHSSYDRQELSFRDVARAHARLLDGSTTRSASPHGVALLGSLLGRPTWHRRVAVFVEVTLDNIFHLLFHALPLREDVLLLRGKSARGEEEAAKREEAKGEEAKREEGGGHGRGSAGGPHVQPVELLPRYTVLWPGASRTRDWVGWTLLSRILSATLGQLPPPEERTKDLLATLNCYPIGIGGHSAFWPLVGNASQLRAAQPRLAMLRRALWRSLQRQGGGGFNSKEWSTWHRQPSLQQGGNKHSRPRSIPSEMAHEHVAARAAEAPILFLLRRSSSRAITNIADVRAAIKTHPCLGRAGVVRFASLETMALVDQLRAVRAARVMVGAHGQGMVWSAMMPTELATRPGDGQDSRAPPVRFAALELFPRQATQQQTHAWYDIRRWALMAGVEYFLLTTPDDPPQPTPACSLRDFRRCGNLTVVTRTLLEALTLVAQHAYAIEGIAPDATAADGHADSHAPVVRPLLDALEWKARRVRERWRITGADASMECAERWAPPRRVSSVGSLARKSSSATAEVERGGVGGGLSCMGSCCVMRWFATSTSTSTGSPPPEP